MPLTLVELALRVAERLDLDARERLDVELAARLHDIGKLAISPQVFEKAEPLTSDEWDLIRTHPARGAALLDQAGGGLREVAKLVRASHERWDGTGYPDGLSGPSIPLPARIVACCDAFTAMRSDRPYRLAMSPEVALRELVDGAGTQFDPHVVRALIAAVRRQRLDPLPAVRSPDGDRRPDRAGAGSA